VHEPASLQVDSLLSLDLQDHATPERVEEGLQETNKFSIEDSLLEARLLEAQDEVIGDEEEDVGTPAEDPFENLDYESGHSPVGSGDEGVDDESPQRHMYVGVEATNGADSLVPDNEQASFNDKHNLVRYKMDINRELSTEVEDGPKSSEDDGEDGSVRNVEDDAYGSSSDERKGSESSAEKELCSAPGEECVNTDVSQ
jgi:hypothetical protein